MNLTPNYSFKYATTTVINSHILSSYDVLVMPGGDGYAYVNGNTIDSQALKQFVSGGKGYLGICAGAYAASNYVDGYYSGWGLTPDVNTKNALYEGYLSVSTTNYGGNILNESQLNLYHQNGPVLYSKDSSHSLAIYVDNKTGYQNYSAIIGETYGTGRVLLSGSHPELNSQDSQLLARMILWAAYKIR